LQREIHKERPSTERAAKNPMILVWLSVCAIQVSAGVISGAGFIESAYLRV